MNAELREELNESQKSNAIYRALLGDQSKVIERIVRYSPTLNKLKQSESEQEGETITNKLNKRIEALNAEKEILVRALDSELEQMTNKLQRRVSQVTKTNLN